MTTMADVARHAGVTKQTVSNVITGKAIVREQTRARVLAAIAELGYHPNLVARGLRQGHTSILAILVPAISHPFYAEIIEEVETVADEQNYNLLVCSSHGERQRTHRQLQILSSRSIDGLILLDDRYMTEELIELDRQKFPKFPIILGGWEKEPFPEHFSVIGIDYQHAGSLAARHLLELGHQWDIAVIPEIPAHAPRLKGFQTELSNAGIALAPAMIIPKEFSTFEAGYQATRTLLSQQPLPRAIFATTDLMALGSLEAIRNAGLHVPEDISVIGVDNIFQAQHSSPSLTTVALPKREMARRMTQLLLHTIVEEKEPPHRLELLQPSLIVRNSTQALTVQRSTAVS